MEKKTEEFTETSEILLEKFVDGESLRCKKKTILQKWQKILLSIFIICCVIFLGGILTFSVLRLRGEKSLKTQGKSIVYSGKEYKYRENVVNILCLGIDKDVPIPYIEAGRGNIGMSDAILLVSLDVENDNAKIIAIPRDTMADVQMTTAEGKITTKSKLQICYQYCFGVSMQQGNELTKDAITQLLYDVPIQRCCAINGSALPILNDAIGGVDVEVIEEGIDEFEPRFKYGEKIHLEGNLAESYVSVRNKHRVDGAVLRTQRQKQYALAFIEKAKSIVRDDPTIPLTIYQELQKDKNMYTDITVEDISYLLPEVLKMSFSEDVIQVLPGESTVGESGMGEYHMDIDAVKKLIIDTFYEEI